MERPTIALTTNKKTIELKKTYKYLQINLLFTFYNTLLNSKLIINTLNKIMHNYKS